VSTGIYLCKTYHMLWIVARLCWVVAMCFLPVWSLKGCTFDVHRWIFYSCLWRKTMHQILDKQQYHWRHIWQTHTHSPKGLLGIPVQFLINAINQSHIQCIENMDHHALFPLCRWCWWCNGMRDGFWHTLGPFSAIWASFKCHGLPEHCFWPCPHPLMATSSRIMPIP